MLTFGICAAEASMKKHVNIWNTWKSHVKWLPKKCITKFKTILKTGEMCPSVKHLLTGKYE